MNLKANLDIIRHDKPLIHCITNHISINDCANAVLASGAKPIMAEHPKEVAEITKMSEALAVNLGNISDSRMKSIMISGEIAKEYKIPSVIDVVGVACSKLRLDFAREYIDKYNPSVIKGNEAEIRALCGFDFCTKGVDSQSESSDNELTFLCQKASEMFCSTVLISGKTDCVSDGNKTALVKNGSYLMPYVTGTGCIMNVICAVLLSKNEPFASAVNSAVLMGLAGEKAEEKFNKENSITFFHNSIIDALFLMSDDEILEKGRVEIYE